MSLPAKRAGTWWWPSSRQDDLLRAHGSITHTTDEQIASQVKFSPEQIALIRQTYKKYAYKGELMDRQRYRNSLGVLAMDNANFLADRMFALIDADNDGVVHFIDYLKYLDVVINRDPYEKAKMSFRFIDSEGKGYIVYDDIRALIGQVALFWKDLTGQTIIPQKEHIDDIFTVLDQRGVGEVQLSDFYKAYYDQKSYFQWFKLFNQEEMIEVKLAKIESLEILRQNEQLLILEIENAMKNVEAEVSDLVVQLSRIAKRLSQLRERDKQNSKMKALKNQQKKQSQMIRLSKIGLGQEKVRTSSFAKTRQMSPPQKEEIRIINIKEVQNEKEDYANPVQRAPKRALDPQNKRSSQQEGSIALLLDDQQQQSKKLSILQQDQTKSKASLESNSLNGKNIHHHPSIDLSTNETQIVTVSQNYRLPAGATQQNNNSYQSLLPTNRSITQQNTLDQQQQSQQDQLPRQGNPKQSQPFSVKQPSQQNIQQYDQFDEILKSSKTTTGNQEENPFLIAKQPPKYTFQPTTVQPQQQKKPQQVKEKFIFKQQNQSFAGRSSMNLSHTQVSQQGVDRTQRLINQPLQLNQLVFNNKPSNASFNQAMYNDLNNCFACKTNFSEQRLELKGFMRGNKEINSAESSSSQAEMKVVARKKQIFEPIQTTRQTPRDLENNNNSKGSIDGSKMIALPRSNKTESRIIFLPIKNEENTVQQIPEIILPKSQQMIHVEEVLSRQGSRESTFKTDIFTPQNQLKSSQQSIPDRESLLLASIQQPQQQEIVQKSTQNVGTKEIILQTEVSERDPTSQKMERSQQMEYLSARSPLSIALKGQSREYSPIHNLNIKKLSSLSLNFGSLSEISSNDITATAEQGSLLKRDREYYENKNQIKRAILGGEMGEVSGPISINQPTSKNLGDNDPETEDENDFNNNRSYLEYKFKMLRSQESEQHNASPKRGRHHSEIIKKQSLQQLKLKYSPSKDPTNYLNSAYSSKNTSNSLKQIVLHSKQNGHSPPNRQSSQVKNSFQFREGEEESDDEGEEDDESLDDSDESDVEAYGSAANSPSSNQTNIEAYIMEEYSKIEIQIRNQLHLIDAYQNKLAQLEEAKEQRKKSMAKQSSKSTALVAASKSLTSFQQQQQPQISQEDYKSKGTLRFIKEMTLQQPEVIDEEQSSIPSMDSNQLIKNKKKERERYISQTSSPLAVQQQCRDCGGVHNNSTSCHNIPHRKSISISESQNDNTGSNFRKSTIKNMPALLSSNKESKVDANKALSLYIGHEVWNMALQMMLVVRSAIKSLKKINHPALNTNNNLNLQATLSEIKLQNLNKALSNENSNNNNNLLTNSSVEKRVSTINVIIPLEVKLKDFETHSQQLLLSSTSTSNAFFSHCEYIDYCPLVFESLRRINGINQEQILRSLGPENLIGNLIMGRVAHIAELCRSSAKPGKKFQYYSECGQFIIKTISEVQAHQFIKMLPNYYNHISSQPNSLLLRVFGMYKLQMRDDPSKKSKKRNSNQPLSSPTFNSPQLQFNSNNKTNQTLSSNISSQTAPVPETLSMLTKHSIHFIICKNVFNTNLDIQHRFELKGSTRGRKAVKRSMPTPNQTLPKKDLDWIKSNMRLKLDETLKQQFLGQLLKDAAFLASNNIINYCVLLGVHQFKRQDDKSNNLAVHRGSLLEAPEIFPPQTSKNISENKFNPFNQNASEIARYLNSNNNNNNNNYSDQQLFAKMVSADKKFIYFIGAINIFTEFTTSKKWIAMIKNPFLGKTQSTVDPDTYASRLHTFFTTRVLE